MRKFRDGTGKSWAFWKTFLIPDARRPEVTYLKRLRIVQTPWFGVYLHWIYLPDDDRDMHDHPWSFWSLIVRGGYTERTQTTISGVRLTGLDPVLRRHRTFSLHKHPLARAHRIVDLRPKTITLLLVGRRCREWGFYTDQGFVIWTEYLRG